MPPGFGYHERDARATIWARDIPPGLPYRRFDVRVGCVHVRQQLAGNGHDRPEFECVDEDVRRNGAASHDRHADGFEHVLHQCTRTFPGSDITSGTLLPP